MVPTIRDVAQRARVSISTVSRVLNNKTTVDQEMRRRVLEAAGDLGYSPNPNARGLLGQSTGGIGVLLPYIAGEFFSEFLQGIDRTTSETGHHLLVASSHRSETEFRTVLRQIDRRVDGLVVMSTDIPAETVRSWVQSTMPLLFVNTEVSSPEIDAINFDNRGGAYRLTAHLVERGHRRIAFLTGPPSSHDAIQRLEGYRAALRDHGLTPDPALVLEGDFKMETGQAAAPALLALDPRPTALFAANDVSAYGALSGLRDAGLDVPTDMALAGFDDIQLARFSSPSLTTVRVPMQEMGEVAIERLLALVGGQDASPPGVVELPTEVVVRQSTAR